MSRTAPGCLTALLMALLLSVLPAGCVAPRSRPAAPTPRPRAPWDKPGWTLTFHDEFDGAALDTTRWLDSYPHGVRTHGHAEQEFYAPTGVTVGGGRLRLTAERRRQGGKRYTSGMISSYGHFAQTYGWFEIRAKFPAGKGLWPAFWLLPATGAWPPEIDVLEILGHRPNTVYMTNHWVVGAHQQKGAGWTGPDFSRDYHTFAVDWEPGVIVWYVDGVERARSDRFVPAEPMFVLANLAVGGDWPGRPNAATRFPAVMAVDYIRVYQRPRPAPAWPLPDASDAQPPKSTE